MKKGIKTKETAGQAEQKLPGAAEVNAGANLPSQAERAAHDSSGTTAITQGTGTTESSTHLSRSESRSIERTADLMMVHATKLRDTGGESLRVVIKPGSGLQLSLDLHRDENGILIRALLNRGDFNFLSQRWTELQQNLEARGVRLAPLLCEDQELASRHHSHKERKSHQSEETEIFGDFDFSEPSSSRSPRKPRGGKWESWA